MPYYPRMTVAEAATLLDRDNLGPQVVSHLGRSADADQMRKYWTHLWDYAELGIFTVREQHYLEAKQRLDAARGEQRKYNALELAGEEGATCYFGPAIVVLLPQLTWDGFKRGDRQKTGTLVHELTHAEDQILNGDPSKHPVVLTLWSEFFAETPAALFYETETRLKDLRVGMDLAVTGKLEFASSLAQMGRLLGFLNGCGLGADTVGAIFADYGRWWQTAAVTVYPVLQKCIGGDRKPGSKALEEGIAALFRQ